MGLFRFILTALLGLFAVIAGLFAAFIVAVTGIISSILGGPRSKRPGRRPSAQQPQAQSRPRQKSRPVDTDVIDVDASEVRE